MQIAGRSAVITGAGSGIGEALAHCLAARGANLALVDIQTERIDAVAKEIAATAGERKITTHTADVSDRAQMQTLAAEVVDAHGDVQILVNNAGVTTWGHLEDTDLDDFEWVIGVNFFGVVHGCKFFLPHLKAQPQAHIVNVSSMFGWVAVPSQTSYCASKYAVRGFSEALEAELADTDVGMTIVHPGGVSTRLMRDSRAGTQEFRDRFTPLAERAMSADKVAEKIANAVERDRFRVVSGPEAYVTEWIKRLAPVRGQQKLARFLKKSMGL